MILFRFIEEEDPLLIRRILHYNINKVYNRQRK